MLLAIFVGWPEPQFCYLSYGYKLWGLNNIVYISGQCLAYHKHLIGVSNSCSHYSCFHTGIRNSIQQGLPTSKKGASLALSEAGSWLEVERRLASGTCLGAQRPLLSRGTSPWCLPGPAGRNSRASRKGGTRESRAMKAIAAAWSLESGARRGHQQLFVTLGQGSGIFTPFLVVF